MKFYRKTRKFVMAILHGRQKLLCDKCIYKSVKSIFVSQSTESCVDSSVLKKKKMYIYILTSLCGLERLTRDDTFYALVGRGHIFFPVYLFVCLFLCFFPFLRLSIREKKKTWPLLLNSK